MLTAGTLSPAAIARKAGVGRDGQLAMDWRRGQIPGIGPES